MLQSGVFGNDRASNREERIPGCKHVRFLPIVFVFWICFRCSISPHMTWGAWIMARLRNIVAAIVSTQVSPKFELLLADHKNIFARFAAVMQTDKQW
jgi:hypothetical protein